VTYNAWKVRLVTDFELIERALNGDDQAFEVIVKRYEHQVAAAVISMLGNHEAADDVGQEVFIRFYKSMHKYHGAASLGTYLTRIAINLSINELNRRKRRLKLFSRPGDENYEQPAADSEETHEEAERRVLVQQAIRKLEPKFRAVIVLRLMQGYSTGETAEILGIPVGTVLSRLSRAQLKLKQHLVPVIQEEA